MSAPSPLNKWKDSLPEGQVAERAIAMLLYSQLGMKVTQNNAEDPTATDMTATVTFDHKILRAPYPSDPTPAGLPRDRHVTLDMKDVLKYPNDTAFVLTVDYTDAGVDTAGVYWITAGEVREILAKNPKRAYSRSPRGDKDKIAKMGIDINECNQWRFGNISGYATGEVVVALTESLKADKRAKA